MSRVLIKNIRKLFQVYSESPQPIRGKFMNNIPFIENAWLALDSGLIADFGIMDTFPGIDNWKDLQIIDAENKFVYPSWVDCHSHIVFAKSREGEFRDRINGISYEAIAAKGGGILNSAKHLNKLTEDELFDRSLHRLNTLIPFGTGTLEIKSGYGLTTDAELKMLRVIKRLKDYSPVLIKSTYLAAHAIPSEYKENKKAYLDLIINKTLPKVSNEGLADFIDVFCEKNYFDPDECELILNQGKKHGLIPKVHAEQLSRHGGVEIAVKVGAISADHLEYVNEKDIELFSKSKTIPVILPGAAFFLSLPYPPVRKMIDAGLAIALASDFNPGSSPSGNMNMMQSIACVQYGMSPEEAFNASTINAAYAMGVENEVGSITIGKRANVIISKEMEDLALISYYFGMNTIETHIVNGHVFHYP